MISKLPRWVWIPAWLFAFVAGMVNVVGFMGFEHQAITHLTGTTSMLAVSLAARDLAAVMRFSTIIGSFVAGCVLSGFLIRDSSLQLGRGYGLALALESMLLCGAAVLLKRSSDGGFFLAAGACGLQNAMVSSFSGAVIRTTHLSGMFTDLGIFLGRALRGLPVEKLRLKLCLIIISAFFCGGVAGASGFSRLGCSILFLPAMITGATALYYELRFRPRNENPPAG